MTVAPGLIQSPRIISGRPMAATSTSARRQTEGRSLVREWVINGHCRILRQEKLRHRFADNVRAASHNGLKARTRGLMSLGKKHTAHRGARHERRQPTSKAALIDQMETVDILRWIDCGNDLLCVDLFGEGNWTRIPLTSSSALSLATRASNSASLVDAASLQSKARIPDSATALDLLPT